MPDVTLSDIGDAVSALIASHRELAALVTRRPSDIPLSLSASAVADANGNALLVFDPVSQGESWELRRLVVGGVTWGTTAAGTAVAYKTSGFATTTPGLTAVFDQAPSLPNVAFYLSKQVPVLSGEKVVVLISGATTSQQYLASGQFIRN